MRFIIAAVAIILSIQIVDARPRAWCGWWLRHELGVSDSKYDLAHAWMGYGHATFPHPGAVGVMWRRHVGKVVGFCRNGVLLKSGNTWGRNVSGGVGTACYPLSAFRGFRQ